MHLLLRWLTLNWGLCKINRWIINKQLLPGKETMRIKNIGWQTITKGVNITKQSVLSFLISFCQLLKPLLWTCSWYEPFISKWSKNEEKSSRFECWGLSYDSEVKIFMVWGKLQPFLDRVRRSGAFMWVGAACVKQSGEQLDLLHPGERGKTLLGGADHRVPQWSRSQAKALRGSYTQKASKYPLGPGQTCLLKLSSDWFGFIRLQF